MIARSLLPAEFVAWNAWTGAPSSGPFAQAVAGPTTRVWEYPWAWHAARPRPGMRTLDVGGGLSGFPLALALQGMEVAVVDPDPEDHAPPAILHAWARSWSARVSYTRCRVDEMDDPDEGYDLAFCISVIEHIPSREERLSLMRGVWRLLKPGALFVVTVDLFLGLHPFTERTLQGDARNVLISELLSAAPFDLAFGVREELYGMTGFSAGSIRSRAEAGEILVGGGGVMSQCFVLAKPRATPMDAQEGR